MTKIVRYRPYLWVLSSTVVAGVGLGVGFSFFKLKEALDIRHKDISSFSNNEKDGNIEKNEKNETCPLSANFENLVEKLETEDRDLYMKDIGARLAY